MKQFLGNLWGRVLAVLAALALFGAVAAEIVTASKASSGARVAQLQADYASMKQKAEADVAHYTAAIAEQTAKNADLREKSDASAAAFASQVQAEVAKNAAIKQQAESDLKRAEADLEEANSVYAKRQALAEAAKVEAELANVKANIAFLRPQLVQCYRPCASENAGRGDFAGCLARCMTSLVNTLR